MNSSIDGRISPAMSRTVLVASASRGNIATTVVGGSWAGMRRRVTSVITPSVPSEPTNNFVRGRPATSLSRGPPSSTARPSARTTVMPST